MTSSLTHRRKNKGTCSSATTVTLTPGGVIEKVAVGDGCDGNLKAVCALLEGRSAGDAITLLRDIRCEDKPTSCAHQIALCLEEAQALMDAPVN